MPDARGKRKGRRVVILDRDALAEVVEYVTTLAPDLIPLTTRWRIGKRKADAIRHETLQAIRDVLEGSRATRSHAMLARLEEAAFTPDGVDISIFYRSWLAERIDQVFDVRLPYWVPDPKERIRALRADEVEEPASQDLREIMRSKFLEPNGLSYRRFLDAKDLLKRLKETPARQLLEEFEIWIAEHGHGDRSDNPLLFAFAQLRILAPLLESPHSAYVERHWRELSDDELRRFVAAGIAREKIMLNRAPESRRIQAVLAGELPPTR